MVSGEPSNSLPGPPHNHPSKRVDCGVPPSPFQDGHPSSPPSHPSLGLATLTTAGEEEEVPGEEAGGATKGPPIQHICRVANSVARCGERLEGQAAHAHLLPVCKWAMPGRGVHHQGAPHPTQHPKIPTSPCNTSPVH